MAVGRFMGVFYADEGMIGSRDPEWLQGTINVLIGLFRRVILMTNVARSKTMTCQLGAICTGMSEEAFSWRRIGEGAKNRESLRRRILCPYCGLELTSGSMVENHRQLHGTEPEIDWV